MALLSLQGVTLNLGGKTLLDTADLHVEQGERVCLVGRNGVGKSSLMALLSGDLTPDGGTIVRTPGVTFGHMPQAVPDHCHGPRGSALRRQTGAGPRPPPERGRLGTPRRHP